MLGPSGFIPGICTGDSPPGKAGAADGALGGGVGAAGADGLAVSAGAGDGEASAATGLAVASAAGEEAAGEETASGDATGADVDGAARTATCADATNQKNAHRTQATRAFVMRTKDLLRFSLGSAIASLTTDRGERCGNDSAKLPAPVRRSDCKSFNPNVFQPHAKPRRARHD
jgi:hypothetical protein